MFNVVAVSLNQRLLKTMCRLLLFSEAKRIEMFAATAAFAAVQVVFIGSIPVGG